MRLDQKVVDIAISSAVPSEQVVDAVKFISFTCEFYLRTLWNFILKP